MRKLPEPILLAIESGRIPSPPQLLLRLLQIVDDDRATMTELATLVEQDPGLTARILSVANSPALRRGKELKSLENCLVALGTRLVRSIATCLSIQNLFDRRTGISSAEISLFWAHSLLVAELARSLAEQANYPRPDEAYLAGLLHDVGELILYSALGNPYAELLSLSADESTLSAAEQSSFGVDHAEVGTWLADTWELDSAFADGILFHHAPAEQIAQAARLPQLVWLAHALAAESEISAALLALDQSLFGNRGSTNLQQIRDQAEQRTLQIGGALGLELPEQITGLKRWQNLKTAAVQVAQPDEAEDEIAGMIGGMALLKPLQHDLFALESDAEILLSLRESARILFDLNRLAFLRCTPPDGKLSGNTIGGQPAIFRQIEIPQEAQRSLAAAAVIRQEILSTFDLLETTPHSLIDVQFARAFSTDGLLCIPMIARHRAVGVMVCGLSQTQHTRLARRLPWLLNFGRIAAISLEALQEAKDYRQQAEDEASGRFTRQAHRIIHEASNPLGIIKSYLKILDRKLPEDTGVRQELGILTEEIDRVASIVGRMSEIPRAQIQGGGLDLGELVQELLLLYGDALFQSKGIQLEAALPGVPLRVRCERDSLKQILLNLWKNASEAMSPGQQIRITATDHVRHNGLAYIQLTIDDNGPGMSDAAMRSIHRPAEAAGAGRRGMGLAIVGELASRQGIPITCRSQPGSGTSMNLLLPRYVDPDATLAETQPYQAPR